MSSFFPSSQELEGPGGDATSSTAATGDVGEDEPDDSSQPSLEEALAKLGLTSLTKSFQREQIDFDSLVMSAVFTLIMLVKLNFVKYFHSRKHTCT